MYRITFHLLNNEKSTTTKMKSKAAITPERSIGYCVVGGHCAVNAQNAYISFKIFQNNSAETS